MVEDLYFFIGVPSLLALITYFTYQYIHSGWTTPIEVNEKPNLSILQHATTLFYKHHLGSYSQHSSFLSEIFSLLPQGASTIQVFYDDESTTLTHRLQSAIGCIFGENDEDFYTHNFAVQLKRFGYERMVLSPLGKVLHVRCPYNMSFFSKWNLTYRVRPALKKAFEALEDKPEPRIIVQVIDSSQNIVDCFIPLEGVENFVDAQYLPTDELEGKLARKKFDSDEGSSESEPEHSDNEAEDREDSEYDNNEE